MPRFILTACLTLSTREPASQLHDSDPALQEGWEMAQQVRVLAAIPDLSLLPSTYVRVLHNCRQLRLLGS